MKPPSWCTDALTEAIDFGKHMCYRGRQGSTAGWHRIKHCGCVRRECSTKGGRRSHDGAPDVQVWKDITERIAQSLQELEAVSPPNANQLKEKNLTQEGVEADLRKRDPVLPER
jgi:hypothetical protein